MRPPPPGATPGSSRTGAALPLVLIVVLLAATLGSTFFFTTRGGYRATAQSAYRLRLQVFMISALDEARARIFQLTTPGAGGANIEDPGLRSRILDAIPVPIEPIEPGTEDIFQNPPDLSRIRFEVPLDLYKGKDVLWASRAITFADVPSGAQDAGRVEILEAKARIHGLRYVPYEDTGSFPGPKDYYQSQTPFKDASYWQRDYMGYCTVTIHARLKTRIGNGDTLELERKMSVTHDIKIADTRPPARDFVLFSYRSPVGDDDRVYKALNEGGRNGSGTSRYDPSNPPSGRLILYPMGLGRVYIRGPYVTLVEGHTDGLGGKNPQTGPTYPQGRYGNWGGFGQVPGPRGVIMPWKWNIGEWDTAPSPIRPQKACTNDFSDGSAQVGLPVFNNAMDFLKTGDSAGYGMSGLYLASSWGPNRQRFYLTGEPQCFGEGRPECNTDAFRGILVKNFKNLDDAKLEAGEQDYMHVWAPKARQDGSWTLGGVTFGDKEIPLEDGDMVRPESGPLDLGLYTVVKFYPFQAGKNCPRTSVDGIGSFFTRVGEEVGAGLDWTVETVSFGAFTSEGYTRRWKDNERDAGLRWDNPLSDLVRLADKKLGNPLPEMREGEDFEKYLERLEPDMAVLPYGLYYQEPKNQGWLNTLFTTLLDGALMLFILVPGPGIIANVGLRAAGRVGTQATRSLARGLFMQSQKTFTRRIATDVVAAYTIDRAVIQAGNDRFRPDSTLPDVDNPLDVGGSRPVTEITSQNFQEEMDRVRQQTQAQDGQALLDDLNALEGNVSEGDLQQAEQLGDQVGSLKKILTAYAEMGRRWEDAAPFLNSMMTGTPGPGGQSAADLQQRYQQLRDYESFGDMQRMDVQQQQYVGFLPPGIKPYQRLATQWYGDLGELIGPSGDLYLDGVVAVDRLPQRGATAFSTTIKYRGRGVLVSTSGADGANDSPQLMGNIEPVDRNFDHLTLSYWNHVTPENAKGKDGKGMLSLGGDTYWMSVVSPYGVNPLGRDTTIRGNMITQFLDRHRYLDSANLRLVYRWEVLRPDLATDGAAAAARTPGESKGIFSEDSIRGWQSVTVSPKVCGWYDSVQ